MKIVRRGLCWAFWLFSVILTFIPERAFLICGFIDKEMIEKGRPFSLLDVDAYNVIIMKVVLFIGLFVVLCIVSYFYARFRNSVQIKYDGCTVVVEYGNLLEKKNCQRVINFDECYTSEVGNAPAQIKKDTVCGQYLMRNPNLDIRAIIAASNAKPCRGKSKYNHLICYEPGTIVPYGDDLLMAFTRLEKDGNSMKFTLEEYQKCLSRLWKEIDNNFCNKDVCIPVLGAGIARFENGISQSISKQELIDLIIASYKLSPHKLKSNYTLRIVVYERSDDFSIEKVSG